MSTARTLLAMLLGVFATAGCGAESEAAFSETSSAAAATAPETRRAASPAPSASLAITAPLAARTWADWLAVRDRAPMRDVTVLCATDEEFRSACRGPWQDDIRSRLAAASAVFEREFRIRFVPVAFREWTSAPTAPDIHALQRAAAAALTSEAADLTLVFIRQDAPAASRPNLYDRGVTYYYGRTALVRTGAPPGAAHLHEWPYEAETLVHELAHTFGAWHVGSPTSIMRAPKVGDPAETFGPTSGAAVVLCRNVDLRRGVESLTDTQIAQITALWREAHLGGTDHPVLDALHARGWVHEIAGRLDAAVADYERAIEMASMTGAPRPRRLATLMWRGWPAARTASRSSR